MAVDVTRKRLRQLGSKRARLDAARAALGVELRDAVLAARKEGVRGPEIARLTGISHQAVYQIIEKGV